MALCWAEAFASVRQLRMCWPVSRAVALDVELRSQDGAKFSWLKRAWTLPEDSLGWVRDESSLVRS